MNNLDIFFVFSLGGHAHPRCLVYEPKTPFTVYKKSLENWRGWCGLFVQIQNPHDFKRGLSKYEFDGLRLNCGHVGRPCGKFVYIDFFCLFLFAGWFIILGVYVWGAHHHMVSRKTKNQFQNYFHEFFRRWKMKFV